MTTPITPDECRELTERLGIEPHIKYGWDYVTDEKLKYYSHPKMQEKFQEAMGNSRERDHFYCLACGANFTKRQDDCNCNDYESERWIILPLPIDPVNPERGLWGMCPGVVTIGKQLFIPGSYFVSVRITDENGNYKKFISFKGDTPTLVLLKALAHQWGVEVEG